MLGGWERIREENRRERRGEGRRGVEGRGEERKER